VRSWYNKHMQKIKDNDIQIIPLQQSDELRQDEILTRLEIVEFRVEELNTPQVGD